MTRQFILSRTVPIVSRGQYSRFCPNCPTPLGGTGGRDTIGTYQKTHLAPGPNLNWSRFGATPEDRPQPPEKQPLQRDTAFAGVKMGKLEVVR